MLDTYTKHCLIVETVIMIRILADTVILTRMIVETVILICVTGTAADTEYTTNMISAQLELHRLNTGRTARVKTAEQLLKQYLFR